MSPRLPIQPHLKPWYRVVETSGRLVVEYAQRVVVFEGAAATRLLPALLPLLDGTRTVEDAVEYLGERVEPAVRKALEALAEHGLLGEGPQPGDDAPASFRETATLIAATSGRAATAADVLLALERARVGIGGAGRIGGEVARLLHLSGVAAVREVALDSGDADPAPLALAVVAPGSQQLHLVSRWNDRALATEQPWLLVLPYDGRFAAVGPLFLPGETCCYECFCMRRAAGLEYPEEFRAVEGSPPPRRTSPALDAAVAGLAATVALQFVTGGLNALAGSFYALELGATLGLTSHRVYRVPRCGVCSGLAELAEPLPWFKEVSRAAA